MNVLLKSRLEEDFPKQMSKRKLEIDRQAKDDKGLADALTFTSPNTTGGRDRGAVGANSAPTRSFWDNWGVGLGLRDSSRSLDNASVNNRDDGEAGGERGGLEGARNDAVGDEGGSGGSGGAPVLTVHPVDNVNGRAGRRGTMVGISVPVAPTDINWAELRRSYSNLLTRSAGPRFVLALTLTLLLMIVVPLLSTGSPSVVAKAEGIRGADHSLQKPVRAWTPQDVSVWLTNNSLTEALPLDVVTANNIDGKLLLRLDEHDLEELTTLRSFKHKQFTLVLDDLRDRDKFLSIDFWEYRSQNRYQVQMLTSGSISCPRLTLIYLLWSQPNTLQPLLTPGMPFFVSLLGCVFTPNLLAAWHAVGFFSNQPLTTLMYMMTFNVAFVAEAFLIYECIQNKNWRPYLRACQHGIVWVSLLLTFFPVVPWFVCDVLFIASMVLPVTVPLFGLLVQGYQLMRREMTRHAARLPF